MDIFFIVLGLGFLVASWRFVHFCAALERIGGEKR
jgi:hypothetical protein